MRTGAVPNTQGFRAASFRILVVGICQAPKCQAQPLHISQVKVQLLEASYSGMTSTGLPGTTGTARTPQQAPERLSVATHRILSSLKAFWP